MSMWCLWGRELLAVSASEPALEKRIRGIVTNAGCRIENTTDSGGGRIFTFGCTCDTYDGICRIAMENHFMDAPPAVFTGGWGSYRLITFEEENIRPFFKELNSRGKTELLCKRQVSLDLIPNSMSLNCVLPDLTEKQKEALTTALRYGYYSTPRSTTTDVVAKSLGIGRSTFESHLRRGENKIISSIMPYIHLMTPKMPDRAAKKPVRRIKALS